MNDTRYEFLIFIKTENFYSSFIFFDISYLESSSERSNLDGNNAQSDNPALVPFVKMALVGVPLEAIIQKMRAHGIKEEEIKIFMEQQKEKFGISYAWWDAKFQHECDKVATDGAGIIWTSNSSNQNYKKCLAFS